MPGFPNFFDTHCHIQDTAFDADRDEVLARMGEKGVWATVVGTDKKTSREAVMLAQQHKNLFAAVGLHPLDNRRRGERRGRVGRV